MSEGASVRQEHASRVLLIGYGNPSRRDDGVAFHVLDRLRQRLGLPDRPLDAEIADAQEDEWLQDRLVIKRLHQLTPELAEELAQFDIVVLIDAHVQGVGWDAVHWQEISPAYRSSMVSHHLSPTSLLALCQTLYGHCARGYVLSVVGSDFDFGEELSPGTAGLLDEAVGRLLDLLRIECFPIGS